MWNVAFSLEEVFEDSQCLRRIAQQRAYARRSFREKAKTCSPSSQN